jgi:fructose-bisphosphate aldolase class I
MKLFHLILFFSCFINVFGYTPWQNELFENSKKLTSYGKGILAMDESTTTIGKRFDSISLPNTFSNRQSYRKLLLSCPDLEKYISGIILSEETFNQEYRRKLMKSNILYGVKVDCGLVPFLGGASNEFSSVGLDTLDCRCKEYYKKGARFTKWRTVYSVHPSELMIQENSWTLSRFARISQENGLVPIIEPEIVMDGNHTIEECSIVQEKILNSLYSMLFKHNVLLEGTLLKTSMTLPGIENKDDISLETISKLTTRTLERTVPNSVPGILFLSGGLSEENATKYLFGMNKYRNRNNWKLSFSFGRALQHSCLQQWNGKEENKELAQQVLLSRIQSNSCALRGIYINETNRNSTNLFIKNYKY